MSINSPEYTFSYAEGAAKNTDANNDFWLEFDHSGAGGFGSNYIVTGLSITISNFSSASSGGSINVPFKLMGTSYNDILWYGVKTVSLNASSSPTSVTFAVAVTDPAHQSALASRQATMFGIEGGNRADTDALCDVRISSSSATAKIKYIYEEKATETPVKCKTPTGLKITPAGSSVSSTSGTVKVYDINEENVPVSASFAWDGNVDSYSNTSNNCVGFQAQYMHTDGSDTQQWQSLLPVTTTDSQILATPFSFYKTKLRVRALSQHGTEELHSEWAVFNGYLQYVLRTSDPTLTKNAVTTGESVTIGWTTSPANDAYFDGFLVLDSNNTEVARVANKQATSVTFSAPNSAGTYSYYIKPFSNDGYTAIERSLLPATLTVSAQTPTLPDKPTNVSFSSSSSVTSKYINIDIDTSGKTTLYWKAATTGATPTSYTILRNGSQYITGATTTNAYVDVPTTKGSNYTYTVKAVTSAGSSDASDGATVYAYSNPTVTKFALDSDHIKRGTTTTLRWTVSSDANNAIQGYTLYENGSSSSLGASATNKTVPSGTANSYTYYMLVDGARADTQTVERTLYLYDDPDKPTSVQVNGSSSVSVETGSLVQITWTDGTFDSNNQKTGSEIYISSTSPSSGYSLARTVSSGSSAQYTVPDTAGTYYVKVRSKGTYSNSELSDSYVTIVVTEPAQLDPKCKAPTSFYVSPTTSTGNGDPVILVWNEGTDGEDKSVTGNTVTGYEIQIRKYSSVTWSAYKTISGKNITGVSNVYPPEDASVGDQFEFQIRSTCANSLYYSDWKASSNTLTIVAPDEPDDPVEPTTISGVSLYTGGNMVRAYVNYYTGTGFKRCKVHWYDGTRFRLVGWTTGEDVVRVTGVSIRLNGSNVSSVTKSQGETVQLTAQIYPADATNKAVTWTSNSSNVSVDQTGKLTFNSAGNATITVTSLDGNHVATCTATCLGSAEIIPLSDFTLSPGSKILNVNSSTENHFKLSATVNPSNTSYPNLIFSVSADQQKYVKVETEPDNQSCIVTALSATTDIDSVQILVKPTDPNWGTSVKVCHVTVSTTGAVDVDSMAISPTSRTIALGSSFTLTATTSPSTATNKAVEFTLLNLGSGRVSLSNIQDNSCTVTGTTVGDRVYVRAVSKSNRDVYKNCIVTVTEAEEQTTPVSSLTISPSSKTLEEGGSFTLTGTVGPSDATVKDVSFEITSGSGNISLTNITSTSCTVNAINAGTAKIRVKSVDNPSVYNDCSVTINAAELDATIYLATPVPYAGSGTYARLDSDTISNFSGATWTYQKDGATVTPIIYDTKNVVNGGTNIAYGSNERYVVFESAGTYTLTVTLNGKSKSVPITVAAANPGTVKVYAKNMFDTSTAMQNTLLNVEEPYAYGAVCYDRTYGTVTYAKRNGNYATGAAYISSGYTTSDFIDIFTYTNHTISFVKVHSACWYDSNKNYLKSVSTNVRLKEGASEVTAFVPPNAKYVRVSVKNDDVSTAQVGPGVRGSSYLSYNSSRYFSVGNSFTHAIRTTPYDLILDGGVYNLVGEYRSEFDHNGVNIWTEINTTHSTASTWDEFAEGIPIRNRAVTFINSAVLLCDFNAARVPVDDGTRYKFSAISMMRNASLIDARLHVVGAYYGIHDDYEQYNWASDPEYDVTGTGDAVLNPFRIPYTNVYKNCNIKHLESASADVIGAGTGAFSTTIIDGCTLDNGNPSVYTLRYHTPSYTEDYFTPFPWLKNPSSTDTTATVTLKNCKLTNAFRVGYAGAARNWYVKYYLNNCTKLNGSTPIGIMKGVESFTGGVDRTEVYRDGVKVTSFQS